jgi:hypothetical protein
MPRGVSQRKGAPAVKGQAPVPAVPQVTAALAPSSDAQAQLPISYFSLPAVLRLCYVRPPAPKKSFFRTARGSVDDMTGDTLKAYARSIGITQRNVDFLSEARLRQNCKARIYDAMED